MDARRKIVRTIASSYKVLKTKPKKKKKTEHIASVRDALVVMKQVLNTNVFRQVEAVIKKHEQQHEDNKTTQLEVLDEHVSLNLHLPQNASTDILAEPV